MVGRFLSELFSVFFRWWWAAITGTFSLVGAFVAPEHGMTLGRFGIATLVFSVGTLLFMVLSVIAVAWRLYKRVDTHPLVRELVPDQSGHDALTFIIQPGAEPVRPGTHLALFRMTELGVEACAAVLEITVDRTDGRLQAEPRWISSIHKTALQSGHVRTDDLSIRLIPGEALALVERCMKESG